MNKWIKVEDQKPKPYKNVLLYIPCNWGVAFDEGCMCVGSFDIKNNCFLLDSVNEMQKLNQYLNGEQYIVEKKPIQLINFPNLNLAGINFDPSHWQDLPRKPLITFDYIQKNNFFKKFINKLKRNF